jgi:TusA-related sulfurtransferase
MHFVRAFGFVAFAGLLFGQGALRTRVVGTVTEARASGAAVKSDAGDVFSVVFLPETRFRRVAPGETDLSKMQTITAADLAVGDRVLARGTVSEDGKTVTAESVMLMSASDLARKHEKDRAEWMRRGVAGLVVSTDAAANEIKIRIPSMFGQEHFVAVALKENTRLRRYAPDSVRFADAKPGTLAELKAGDQLRALGEKNEDGTRIVAEEVVSGSFRTVAGSVTALDADSGELRMKDLQSGKTLTVKVTPDAVLRRLPQFPMGGMGGGMRPGGGPPGMAGGGPPGGGAPGGGPPGGMRRGMPDFQQMLDRMPPVSLAEIKPGETIVVASTKGASPDRLTAVTLLAGADALIAMSQTAAARSQGQSAPGGQPMGNWNLGDMSMIPMP